MYVRVLEGRASGQRAQLGADELMPLFSMCLAFSLELGKRGHVINGSIRVLGDAASVRISHTAN